MCMYAHASGTTDSPTVTCSCHTTPALEPLPEPAQGEGLRAGPSEKETALVMSGRAAGNSNSEFPQPTQPCLSLPRARSRGTPQIPALKDDILWSLSQCPFYLWAPTSGDRPPSGTRHPQPADRVAETGGRGRRRQGAPARSPRQPTTARAAPPVPLPRSHPTPCPSRPPRATQRSRGWPGWWLAHRERAEEGEEPADPLSVQGLGPSRS